MGYVLALGMMPGELLPPYSYGISPDEIKAFQAYLEELERCGSTVIPLETSIEARFKLDELARQRVDQITVVGAWAELCVALTVTGALIRGLKVIVPEKAIFYKGYYPELATLDSAVGVRFRNRPYESFHDNGIYCFTPING